MKKRKGGGKRCLAAAFGAVFAFLAQDAAAQLAAVNCSQTVAATAAPAPFGSRAPTKYLEICNSHATNTVGINWTGGTAVIGAAGTLTLAAGQCRSWSVPGAIPTALSVIGSATSTTTTCAFY